MKKTLLSLAMVASLGLVSASASAFEMLDFVVDETSATPQISFGAFTIGDPYLAADEINGSYVELFTVTGANTFITSAFWQAATFSRNEGVQVVSAINNGGITPGLGFSYGMYAIFTSDGTFATSGSGSTFTGGTGTIDIYIDPTNNTQLAFALGDTGFDLPNITGGADDYKIAFSTSLFAGDGNLSTGLANGNFDIVFDQFTLVDPEGKDYFISPDPFHLVLDLSGQFIEFTPSATTTLSGTADAHFTVPEPTTLALLGLGLIGMGMGLRRKV